MYNKNDNMKPFKLCLCFVILTFAAIPEIIPLTVSVTFQNATGGNQEVQKPFKVLDKSKPVLNNLFSSERCRHFDILYVFII